MELVKELLETRMCGHSLAPCSYGERIFEGRRQFCTLSTTDDYAFIQAGLVITMKSTEYWRLELNRGSSVQTHLYARHAEGYDDNTDADEVLRDLRLVVDAFHAFYHDEEFSDEIVWEKYDGYVEWWDVNPNL